MEIQLNKIIFVQAYFKPLYKKDTVKVPTGEIKKGLLGGEKQVTRKEKHMKQTGYSDCHIDAERLSQDVSMATESLNAEGYNVTAITPITSGEYDFSWSESLGGHQEGGSGYGYGYGYSYTTGVMILASNID